MHRYYVNLYAGSAPGRPSTGLLAVWVQNPCAGLNVGHSGVYALPGAGALRITAVRRNLVRLDGVGRRHAFDLSTGTFR
jgi:hypothetical protein